MQPTGGHERNARAMIARVRALIARVMERIRRGGGAAGEFERIYLRNEWGSDREFNSGAGSHDPSMVDPYVDAIRAFIASEFKTPPNAVDLGCGDFNVGSRVRPLFADYVACDVVSSLLDRNRQRFGGLSVEFRKVNLIRDALPTGDVAMIRQVLQHLSNRDVMSIIPKLSGYRWVIVTEHLPGGSFEPNVDKPRGSDIRAQRQPPSGVVLTAAPFMLDVTEARRLCVVRADDVSGVIETVAYRLR